MVTVQHVFDLEAMLSSHVIQQAGRNPSKVVALQLAIHAWPQHDSSAENRLRFTNPLVKMVLSYRNRTLVPVFLASAPFRLVSFSSLAAAPRWKLCLYCFLLRLQGNGQCAQETGRYIDRLIGLTKGTCTAGLLWCIPQVARVYSMSSALLGTVTASLLPELPCYACMLVTACQCLQPHYAHGSWFARFPAELSMLH